MDGLSREDLALLARIVGREIAAGMAEHDAAMADADQQARDAADPIERAASALLAAVPAWARAAAQTPRVKGDAIDILLQAWVTYAAALRAHGDSDT